MFVSFLQFAEKFAEYKEAARLAKEKSQEKTEMATSPSQVNSLHHHRFGGNWISDTNVSNMVAPSGRNNKVKNSPVGAALQNV